MPLYAKQEESNFELIQADTYHAVCYGIVDLGHHVNPIFGTNQHKICLLFEIPELEIELKDGNKVVRTISKIYTNSLSEKSNLYKDLTSWRSRAFTEEELKGFDVFTLAGINCLLTIVHSSKNGKTYANIGAISKLMKNMEKLTARNDLVTYSISESGIDNAPKSLPSWIEDMIKKSEEYGEGEPIPDDLGYDEVPPPTDDDIPF